MALDKKQPLSLIGRILMTLPTLNYGVGAAAVDLTQTHVFNPQWTPHSRMHMVWLLATNTAISAVSVYLLWVRGASGTYNVRLAGVLGICVYGGFFLSAATIATYGGSLSDPGGVPPIMGIDANIVGFSVSLIVLLVGWALARQKGA
jgi:hypothetical protein